MSDLCQFPQEWWEKEIERLTNELREAREAIKHIHWSMGDERLDREQIKEHVCNLCDKALEALDTQ